jgi:hypothetical protein
MALREICGFINSEMHQTISSRCIIRVSDGEYACDRYNDTRAYAQKDDFALAEAKEMYQEQVSILRPPGIII